MFKNSYEKIHLFQDKKINKTSKIQDINENDSCDSLDKNFHLRYGNNILPLPPTVTIPKVKGIKHMQNKTIDN